jgi:putative intracellular protease/amidase
MNPQQEGVRLFPMQGNFFRALPGVKRFLPVWSGHRRLGGHRARWEGFIVRPSIGRSVMIGMAQGLFAWVLTALVLATPAQAAGGKTGSGTPTESTKLYDYYLTGNAANVLFALAPDNQMLVLMGGGLDVDAAYVRMIDQARSKETKPVDVVVLRTSGADGYNDYIAGLKPGEVDSVESIVIKSRDGAESDRVNAIVAAADVLFIAGGDQWTYIAMWAGTRLEATIKGLLAKKVPFGGTSAGLAVLGEVDFSAQYNTVDSLRALGCRQRRERRLKPPA